MSLKIFKPQDWLFVMRRGESKSFFATVVANLEFTETSALEVKLNLEKSVLL